jgi:hypothetical protein
MCNFVSFSVPAHRTNRDVVEQIARESQIPVESLSDELELPVYTRGQVIDGFAGDKFDQIADNYDNMKWWISDVGLNMGIVMPASGTRVPTLDDLMLDIPGSPGPVGPESERPGHRKAQKPVRRNQKYMTIDEALQEIAESHPRTQEEVFQALQGRVGFPPAEPFEAARGWMAGFRLDEALARSWLSKRWKELNLPPLPRGPKKLKK